MHASFVKNCVSGNSGCLSCAIKVVVTHLLVMHKYDYTRYGRTANIEKGLLLPYQLFVLNKT